MAIWSNFFSSPNKVQVDSKTIAVDKIFLYVENFINRKDLAEDCVQLRIKADKFSGEEKENQLTKAYFCLEKFVTSNKPLVVKREITTKELRSEIIKNGLAGDLFFKLKIPFLGDKEQVISVFSVAVTDIVRYLKNNIGESNFNILLNKSLTGNKLFGRVSLSGDSLIFDLKNDEIQEQFMGLELEYSLKNLFESLIKEVVAGFGRKMAEALLQESFTRFGSIFPLEFVKIFLDISPIDFLMEQKVSFLAREELQKKLLEAVDEERVRSDEANLLNKKLQEAISELNANKAAVLNLLEDVGKEKDRVEKEVERRTRELRREESVLRSTIDSLPLAYFLINDKFVLLENNNRLSELFSLEKISGFEDLERWFDGFFEIRQHCQSIFDNMKPEVFRDISLTNKFFKIYLQPVASADTGEKIGLLGLIEDVTEQKVLDRSKDEFFSIASHELRTPLTAIMGNTSMILEFFGAQLPGKEVKQMVEDIHEASNRLLKIVGDFLDVSRLEQGKIIFKQEKFDLGELVKDMSRDFESMATLKGLLLKVGEIQKDTFVMGDKDKVKQIVSNLISNAINYTQKGEILLYIKKDEPGKVSLYVKDSGIGVSKENQILLFRKFQQAQEKILTRDASRSTGLGLYISRLLATAMGGEVELVESEQGKGSTFRLVLPLKM